MVESLNAVITNGAMGGPRWTEDLAREAVLQLYRLPFHLKCGNFVRKKRLFFHNSNYHNFKTTWEIKNI